MAASDPVGRRARRIWHFFWVFSALARRGLAALPARGLLLGGGSALARARRRALRLLAATAGRARGVGDLGRPLLGHALVLQRLVLLLVLDVCLLARHVD